jgi:hypothetical protein
MSPSVSSSDTVPDHGFLAPRPDGAPVDHCVRCGVETPPGVALCELHNRGNLSGPSATQMHATIFIGIVLGVIVFFIVARLVVTTTGPFSTAVTTATLAADGSVTLSYTITNEGGRQGVPDCRITRDGVPRPDDLAFRTTAALAAGATQTFQRTLAAPPEGTAGYDTEALTVVCT